jgi:biopolymer transport protein ExbD
MMKSAAGLKRTTVRLSIDVSVLAAILVALFFVLIMKEPSSHDLPKGQVADLPHAEHVIPMPGASREDALHVTVEMDGIVFLGNQHLTLDQLAGGLRKAVRAGAENRVYIHADRRARYGAALDVLNAARDAGIEGVGFLVEDR